MYFIRRTTQPGHYRFFLIPPKNPYSNQATQKNTCQIFVPKKISPWGRNECVTTEPQRTSAGRLQPQVMLILKKIAAQINYVFSSFHVKLELHTTKVAVCLIQICRIQLRKTSNFICIQFPSLLSLHI